jgi:hypothetical protein
LYASLRAAPPPPPAPRLVCFRPFPFPTRASRSPRACLAVQACLVSPGSPAISSPSASLRAAWPASPPRPLARHARDDVAIASSLAPPTLSYTLLVSSQVGLQSQSSSRTATEADSNFPALPPDDASTRDRRLPLPAPQPPSFLRLEASSSREPTPPGPVFLPQSRGPALSLARGPHSPSRSVPTSTSARASRLLLHHRFRWRVRSQASGASSRLAG